MSVTPRPVLTDAVASFQAEVTRLAFSVADAIVRAELARREAVPMVRPPGRPRAVPGPHAPATPSVPRVAQDDGAETTRIGDTSSRMSGAESAPTSGPGKRTPWTRESIIELLASSIASGAPVDAAFMTRNGPRGLVAATRRVFGRFEAALNIAAIQVSKLYPEGAPRKRTSARPIDRQATRTPAGEPAAETGVVSDVRRGRQDAGLSVAYARAAAAPSK